MQFMSRQKDKDGKPTEKGTKKPSKTKGRLVERNLRFLMKLSKEFQVPVELMDCEHNLGQADLIHGAMCINYSILLEKKDFVASVFFHEFTHILMYQLKSYASYHNIHQKKKVTYSDYLTFKRVFLKAERYVDKNAKMLLENFYPRLTYISCYHDKETVKQVRQEIREITYSDFIQHIRYMKKLQKEHDRRTKNEGTKHRRTIRNTKSNKRKKKGSKNKRV